MARGDRGTKKLKSSIPYFIVEGCTEENYIKVLKKLYRKSAKLKNIEGGSAKNILTQAEKIINDNSEYSNFIVWFDDDTLTPNDTNLLNQVKQLTNVNVVISYPCIETFLLAHFQKLNENQLNNSCKSFEDKLKKDYMLNYSKNNCKLLEKSIKIENIENLKINCSKYVNNFDKIFKFFEKML